jgi:hypothetical protein
MGTYLVQTTKEIKLLIEELNDPIQCDQALLALIGEGKAAIPALAEFLRTSKPSSLPQARLLAVEGLGLLKGEGALDALIAVATERLAEIPDPVVRLAEESVASRAALALADFSAPRALETLLRLTAGKPLVGVAEAFEKLRDCRALPYLVRWLEDDFVAEPAGRAILAFERTAIPILMESLSERYTQHGRETRLSHRRRWRILEILDVLLEDDEISVLEAFLGDPVEEVCLKAAHAILNHGNPDQQRRAFKIALQLLDSHDRNNRVAAEELLRGHLAAGPDLLKEEIQKRRAAGESEHMIFPRESALALLVRIQRQTNRSAEPS